MHNRIIPFLVSLFLLSSCVQKVDFSGAYEKKVQMYCVIHAVGYRQYNEYMPGYRGDLFYYPTLQRLYMSYNSPDGSEQTLEDGVYAVLYDSRTGTSLGRFERVSEKEWQMDYAPEVEIVDPTHKKFDLHYRLVAFTASGEKLVEARTVLSRLVDLDAMCAGLSVPPNPAPIPYQQSVITCPAWLLPEIYKAKQKSWYPYYPNEVTPVVPTTMTTTYLYADKFNYDGVSYKYGIRITEDNEPDVVRGFKYSVDGYHTTKDTVYLRSGSLHYVSDDYDRFLHDMIVHMMRHDDKSDPLEHLYEDQVYSNIDGGVGLFGADIISSFPWHAR